jgi:outer membrane lipoprotein-sorting protein
MMQSQRYSPPALKANIKAISLLALILLTSLTNISFCAESQVEDLIKAYSSIKSVTCAVRKTSTAEKHTVRMLSRVHFMTGGFIHVENISPARRRIIADGKSLYYHDSQLTKGFSRPIKSLDDEWMSSLITVPGSPMEHLLKMRHLKEEPSSQDGATTSTAYHGKKNHVLLRTDSKGRITSIEFFEDQAMKKPFGLYEYSDFIKAGKTWLAAKHKASITLPNGTKAKETRQFDNLSVDTEIPAKLFDHRLFMKDIEFVSDFEKTLQ